MPSVRSNFSLFRAAPLFRYGMNIEGENKRDERRRDIERREDESAAETERMLRNTRRFLEQLSDSEPDSRRYVSGLKEHLENDLRRMKQRRENGPRPLGPGREH